MMNENPSERRKGASTPKPVYSAEEGRGISRASGTVSLKNL